MLWRMAIVQAGHEVIEVGVIPWVQPPTQDASDHQDNDVFCKITTGASRTMFFLSRGWLSKIDSI